MAGIENPRGEKYVAFVILTVGANPTVRAMHDRMPLVVEPGQNDKWLFDESYARTIMGTPCLAEMEQQSFDSRTLLNRLEDPSQALFFLSHQFIRRMIMLWNTRMLILKGI